MRRAFAVSQVRQAEAELLAVLPDGELMQRAVAGLAAECMSLLGRARGSASSGRRSLRGAVYGARIVVVAGSGDNGGDALFAAAMLARRGAAVSAVLLSPDRTHSAGLAALLAAGGRIVPSSTAVFSGVDLVLDGVTGIGGHGGLRPEAERLFADLDSVAGPRPLVVAVDVPSGVESDTGEVTGPAVSADVTVTFGAYKPGVLISPGAEHAGKCHFVDIGLTDHLPGAPVLEALEAADVANLLPTPARESDKYQRGVIGIVAGSPKYPGAAVLAVGSALRSGVGAVRFLGETSVSAGVLARHPEVMVSAGEPAEAGRVQAWVVGPGLGISLMAAERLRSVLEQDVPVLIDADGLTLLKQYGLEWLRARRAPTLLTPHVGEAARLLDGSWRRDEVPLMLSSPEADADADTDAVGDVMTEPGWGDADETQIKARGQLWRVDDEPEAAAGEGWVGDDLTHIPGSGMARGRSWETGEETYVAAASGPGRNPSAEVRYAPTLLPAPESETEPLQRIEVSEPEADSDTGDQPTWDRTTIESHRLAAVRELADRYACTVLLKGSTTLIATPDGTTIRVNPTGTPALATAGSGDVLSGLAGGLMAAGLSPYDAASVAAWLHGEAAQTAQRRSAAPIVASDVINALGSGVPGRG